MSFSAIEQKIAYILSRTNSSTIEELGEKLEALELPKEKDRQAETQEQAGDQVSIKKKMYDAILF